LIGYLTQCNFESKYIEDDKTILYRCPEIEEIQINGKCIFHDDDYLKDGIDKKSKEKIVRDKLIDKINESNLENKRLICIGYRLPDITLKMHFDIPVKFDSTLFLGNTNFDGSQFMKHTTFIEARFIGKSNFSDTQFMEKANFSKLHCVGQVDFGNSRFSAAANFSDAQFMKQANFVAAQFMNKANFFASKFMGEGKFNGAQFVEALFSNAEFMNEANFGAVSFMNIANFSLVHFRKKAYFTATSFMNEANFSVVQFDEEAKFDGVQFDEEAKFDGVQFERASFIHARFMQTSSFSGAQFEEVNFNEARFSQGIDLSAAKFAGEATFIGTRFQAFTNNMTTFKHVQFEQPYRINFQVDNLSHVSFLDADISQVRFGENTKWGEGRGNRYKILEEREIELRLTQHEKVHNVILGSILAVYRNLRENYEFRMRYDEAGQFFMREMDMKRKYEVSSSISWKNLFRLQWKINEMRTLERNGETEITLNNWIIRHFSLAGLYYHMSRYGHDLFRPILFGIGIILFSTLLWSTQANPAGDFSFSNFTLLELDNSTNLKIAFERSVTNFIPLVPGQYSELLDLVFKLVGGAVTFGLIIIALRRKFERKFRH
jgi:uncharacterized protein YjbI with pentapeptide repeats